jgi:hypothetical protein
MGAYGAALIARDQWFAKRTERSSLATPDQLAKLKVSLELKRCGGCSNNCLLTVNTFEDGTKARKFVTGNRCERGLETALGVEHRGPALPNLFAEKHRRLFCYRSLGATSAPRGTIGIPRVLNIYENYPLWFTFWHTLGFRVQLPPRSSRRIYERSLESIPSASVCYPGRITHGHVESGVRLAFSPCVVMEKQEDRRTLHKYNCPIVISSPEVIRNNIDAMRQDSTVTYLNPFIPIDDRRRFIERMVEAISARFSIRAREVASAAEAAWAEQRRFQADVRAMGDRALAGVKRRGLRGVVLVGRPYHLDPTINHGIPELINSLGLRFCLRTALRTWVGSSVLCGLLISGWITIGCIGRRTSSRGSRRWSWCS